MILEIQCGEDVFYIEIDTKFNFNSAKDITSMASEKLKLDLKEYHKKYPIDLVQVPQPEKRFLDGLWYTSKGGFVKIKWNVVKGVYLVYLLNEFKSFEFPIDNSGFINTQFGFLKNCRRGDETFVAGTLIKWPLTIG